MRGFTEGVTMCCCDDGDEMITGGTVRRKARKPHKCCECRRPIAAGERYVELSGLWREGGFATFRWCAHCDAGQVIAAARVGDEACWCLGTMWRDFRDAINHDYGVRDMTLCRLIVGAKRKWTVRRGPRKGELVPVPAAASPAVAAGVA